ncbi:MAG: hypothetical protein O3C40_06710 [Planctomycetota bacterium]|nr:hypothetical protein [Planctomycetota bacterium]
MRSALIGLVAAFLLAATGCDHHNLAKNSCSSCQSCGNGSCAAHGGHGGHGHVGNANGYGNGGAIAGHLGTPGPTPVGRLPQGYMQDAGPGGPPTATYGYPYYTTRAPRDFLLDNPPSIGY